jgi:pyruvate kinase
VETARRLALVWGVHPVRVRNIADEHEMVEVACEVAVREGAAKPGDRLVIAAGVPFGTSGTTNMIRVVEIPAEAGGEEKAP